MDRARVITDQNIALASDAILQGNLVAIPTETVYGLAGNAFNASAVSKIFTAKQRPSFDPLIVHVPVSIKTTAQLHEAQIIDASKLSTETMALTDQLIREFWPGPLTIIFPKNDKIPDIVTSGLDRVAVRMPAHPLAQKLLEQCRVPLAAPSANKFGRISPTRAEHVAAELGDQITLILDGGPCEIGIESTVILVDDATIWLIRPGKITPEQLKKFSKKPINLARSEHEKASPGMLLSHYAPRKKMIWIDQLKNKSDTKLPDTPPKKIGLLVPSGDGLVETKILAEQGFQVTTTMLLSASNDPEEAARNLFAAMRKLDDSDVELIVTTKVPDAPGLWPAISDRLKRACQR